MNFGVNKYPKKLPKMHSIEVITLKIKHCPEYNVIFMRTKTPDQIYKHVFSFEENVWYTVI